MKALSISLLFMTTLFSSSVLAQLSGNKDNFVKLAIGKIWFGTGDIPGYSVNLEYSERLKTKTSFLKHFLVGAELSFENGNEQPKVINPTFQEFLNQWYYSTTNIVITPKITYYPFNKTFAKGINISLGLSAGYSNQNTEQQATYIFDPVSQMSIRRSYLAYINEFILGYRVITGYEYFISKHILIGMRLDFDSYTNGDINTLMAGKIGYNF